MIRDAKVGLALCIPLIVVLGIASIWFFMELESLQNEVNTLETDKIDLQGLLDDNKTLLQTTIDEQNRLEAWLDTNKTLLQTTTDERNQLQTWLDGNITNYELQIQNLNSQIGYLEREIISLENEIDALNSSIRDEALLFFYYTKPFEQKFGVYDLRDELQGLEWTEPYQAGVFDCSEMSACLEWYLENAGWNATIVLGDTPFGEGYHAWLLVETSIDHFTPVECTTIEIVWWDNPYFDNYFIYDYRFDTIHEAMSYFKYEFDWWEIL